MRIAVTGNDRHDAVVKVANLLGVEPTKVNQPGVTNELLAYAAESFEHWDENNVVFDGSVLEDRGECDHLPTEGEAAIEEQIILCGLQNYDKVFVVTNAGCLPLWKYLNETMPDKVILVDTAEDIVL